jgi:hypothetical protein
MSIREGCRHREVAADQEAHSRDGVVGAPVEDVPRVVEASTMRACGVIRGGGSVTK